MTLKQKILDNPDVPVDVLAKRLKCGKPYVYQIRRKAKAGPNMKKRRAKHPDDRMPKAPASNGHASPQERTLLKDVETINKIGLDRVKAIVSLLS